MNETTLPPKKDIDMLRRLAARRMEIAEDPVNRERREAWYNLDSGEGDRPMILAEPFGIRDPRSPASTINFECENEWARGLEAGFRNEIYQFEVLRDDHVVEPYWNMNWHAGSSSGYGVDVAWHDSENAGILGARRWDPPLKDLEKDFEKLQHRTFKVDREGTFAARERLEKVFGDILPVRLRGGYYWTMGLTMDLAMLVGMEEMMMAMYDKPEALHRVMAFLRDDFMAFNEWLEKEGLFNLNNENDYIGSGSLGYTHDLPQEDHKNGDPPCMKDLWVLSESQETVGVGPDQFEEFIFPYQLHIAGKFGKCYYGCCEPVHTRIDVIKKFPNLARVSVSPWADEELVTSELGRDYVYSRKPNPSLISTAKFDEDAIRADIRKTLDTAKGCRIELIMKDVHTLHDEPERLPRWVQIAREETGRHS